MARDTILILEDDNASCAKLTEIFQDKYKIQTVFTEREGIDFLRKHAASLAVVLVNIMIPAKDNFQILGWLSEKGFLNRIPFMMITNEMTAGYEKRGYEFGIVGYIRKPFYPEVVKQLVENVIEVFQHRGQLEVMVCPLPRENICSHTISHIT